MEKTTNSQSSRSQAVLHSPVVPAGQLVHTTSCVFSTTAQVAPVGQGQGLQSSEAPRVASP